MDQHIFEVYDNLEIQKNKLKDMLLNITEGTDIKDWTVRDVENLDEHLWTKLKTTLKDIFENTTFRGDTLDDFSKRPKET